MAHIVGKDITGAVDLDGNWFVGCRFVDATLRWQGRGFLIDEDCEISGQCRLEGGDVVREMLRYFVTIFNNPVFNDIARDFMDEAAVDGRDMTFL